jgi:Icc-related predicted phosphoesterase
MKIQVTSDLHNEFELYGLNFEDADILVIVGDLNLGIRGIKWLKETIKIFL